MILVLHIGFYEPFSGAWMTGERHFGVKDERDAQLMAERYTAYFKATYGDSAEITKRIREERRI